MLDILPDELVRFKRLERAFRRTVELCGYSELRTPVLEHTELFVRSIGETTDVVEKEMFTFERSDESLTLRPEGTAGAARAYVTHSVHAKEPVSRFYYLGPMFRAEQPQRGRYRQFYQAGCELYGDPGPIADAEMIDMLYGLFSELGVDGLEFGINSIGGSESRDRFRAALLDYLRPQASRLSEHAQLRLESNPLRVLDSKDPRDQEVCRSAPSILELLTDEDRAHWQGLCLALEALGTPYRSDHTLVRGLDYYTRTVFELRATSGELGSQNTLCAGGRYDHMIQDLGGPNVPAIGFAVGLERTLLAMREASSEATPFCVFLPLGEPAARPALVMAREVRKLGARAEVDGRPASLKSKLRRANSLGARFAIVVGDAELASGVVQLKDLLAHSQEELPQTTAAVVIADRLRGSVTTAARAGSDA
jgi:histidyl-tRNA synthetase